MSRFAVEVSEARKRLAKSPLSSFSKELAEDYLSDCESDEVVLWIDEPWLEVDFDDLISDRLVAGVVLTEPLELDEGLELRDEALLGYWQARDGALWVFLSAVACTDFTTLPDAIAVFGGGLSVSNIACFAAPDAATYVEKRLAARVVLSGMGDGSVSIVPGAALEIGAFHSYLSCAARLDEVVDAEMAAELDEMSAWEVMSSRIG